MNQLYNEKSKYKYRKGKIRYTIFFIDTRQQKLSESGIIREPPKQHFGSFVKYI